MDTTHTRVSPQALEKLRMAVLLTYGTLHGRLLAEVNAGLEAHADVLLAIIQEDDRHVA